MSVKRCDMPPQKSFKIKRNNIILQEHNKTIKGEDLSAYYVVNGALFLITSHALKTVNDKLDPRLERWVPFIMDERASLDIDTPYQFKVAHLLMQEEGKEKIKDIRIGSRLLGENNPAFIIAEAGVNHNGSVSLAKKLIDVAVDAGADAVKFQTFNPDLGTSRYAEKIAYQKETAGESENQYEMLKKLQLTEKQFGELKRHCDRKKIIFLSTASDKESVDIVTRLKVPTYKISSSDITQLPLLKYIAQKKKPIILSTGTATMDEIEEAVETIKKQGNQKIILLQCVSQYPVSYQDANIKAMKTLHETFNSLVGYSDHTLGIAVPITAVAIGASIIEKHFTLDKDLPGPDHKASLSPDELKQMIRSIRNSEAAMGSGEKLPTKDELILAKQCRRSIVVLKGVKKGEVLTKEMVGIKKPENGIPPKYISTIIGKKLKRGLKEDQALNWKDIA